MPETPELLRLIRETGARLRGESGGPQELTDTIRQVARSAPSRPPNRPDIGRGVAWTAAPLVGGGAPPPTSGWRDSVLRGIGTRVGAAPERRFFSPEMLGYILSLTPRWPQGIGYGDATLGSGLGTGLGTVSSPIGAGFGYVPELGTGLGTVGSLIGGGSGYVPGLGTGLGTVGSLIGGGSGYVPGAGAGLVLNGLGGYWPR